MPETLLSIQEAADRVGKSIQTIRRALKTKKLIAKKIIFFIF
jgi:transposase